MNQRRMIRLPVFLEKLLKVGVKVKQRLAGKYSKDPSLGLVAADSEVHLAGVNSTLSVRWEIISVDAPI